MYLRAGWQTGAAAFFMLLRHLLMLLLRCLSWRKLRRMLLELLLTLLRRRCVEVLRHLRRSLLEHRRMMLLHGSRLQMTLRHSLWLMWGRTNRHMRNLLMRRHTNRRMWNLLMRWHNSRCLRGALSNREAAVSPVGSLMGAHHWNDPFQAGDRAIAGGGQAEVHVPAADWVALLVENYDPNRPPVPAHAPPLARDVQRLAAK